MPKRRAPNSPAPADDDGPPFPAAASIAADTAAGAAMPAAARGASLSVSLAWLTSRDLVVAAQVSTGWHARAGALFEEVGAVYYRIRLPPQPGP